MVLDAVLSRMNAFGRIALCGMIAGYDGQPLPLANPQLILINRLKIQGFIVSEHMEVWPEALKELGTLVGTGKLRPRESIAQGIEPAPEAFLGLLKGKNFGKQLVKLHLICAQTASASMRTKRAARADPCTVLLAATEIAPTKHRLPRSKVLGAPRPVCHHCLCKVACAQAAARL
jgi:hypothetical protein